METHQTTPINRDLIKSSGENLKVIGYLIFVNLLISGFFYFLISKSSNIREITNIYMFWGVSSLILIFIIGILFIQSGYNLINSISTLKESSKSLEELDKTEKVKSNVSVIDGFTIKNKYYSNGNIEVSESYNEKNEKEGDWKFYSREGKLIYIETYKTGKKISEKSV